MNTNRISTDIKHAKEALEKKLDSLQLGMDGIPNLLTPSFDSIKNVLASITAKVDNVRGGVDLNHTTLTDLQNRLTKVEGSVGKVEQDVGKVQQGLSALGIPENAKVMTLNTSKTGDVVNVKGSGNLFATIIYRGLIRVKIDGVEKFYVSSTNVSTGSFACASTILGGNYTSVKSDYDVITAFGSLYFPNGVSNTNTLGVSQLTLPYDSITVGQKIENTLLVSKTPLRFSTSLELILELPYEKAGLGYIVYALE